MIDRNKKFTEGNFPVDVLWMDIEWADQRNQGNYQYFYFNPTNFTTKGIEDMNS